MDEEQIEDKFEREYRENREKNQKYLDIFENDIKGLSEKTVELHIENADLLLNEFFYRYEIRDIEEGAAHIESFMDFFIRKCLWSSPYTVKQMAASIKKFYKSMYEHGECEKEDYEYVTGTIKENIEFWMEESDVGDGGDGYGWF